MLFLPAFSSGNMDTLKALTDNPVDFFSHQLEALKTKRALGKDIDKPSRPNFRIGGHPSSYVQILSKYFWGVGCFLAESALSEKLKERCIDRLADYRWNEV